MTDDGGGSPIESGERLYERIITKLQALIADGQLRPGDRLPPERTLAATFRVSRNSVREAIRSLSEAGILQSRRGDGTYVRDVPTGILVESMARAMHDQQGRLRDILEFRKIVEPAIAELAALRMTPAILDRLKILVCDQDREILSGGDGAGLDTEFHATLAKATHNGVVRELVGALNTLVVDSRSEFLQTGHRKRRSVISHLRIIDAMERKDPDMARKAMRDHLDEVERAVFGDDSDE